MDARGLSKMNDYDQYIVIRGLSEQEDGTWYNVTRMARDRMIHNLMDAGGRSSTRPSPDAPAAYLSGTKVTLEATGVLEFGQYGGVAEVYRPVN